jgi:dihydroxyacid dehydratase/phosphogluconate dehydratase
MGLRPPKSRRRNLRSQLWFDNPDNPGMTALYLERYLNYGLTKQELTSGKPIIGIAQIYSRRAFPIHFRQGGNETR